MSDILVENSPKNEMDRKKKKDKSKDKVSSKVFTSSIFGTENNKNVDPAFDELITSAVSAANKGSAKGEGILFISAVALPLDKVNSNDWIVYSDNITNDFIKTFVEPYGIPIIHNHASSGRGGGFAGKDPEPTRIAGRTLSVGVRTIKNGSKKLTGILTGQAIIDNQTIERVMDKKDITQSITYTIAHEECGLCGNQIRECGHYSGELVANEDDRHFGKTGRTSHFPDRAVENSFVAIPAFIDSIVSAIRMNSLENIADQMSLFKYFPKQQWMVGNKPPVSNDIIISPEGLPLDEKHSIINHNDKSNMEVPSMNTEELIDTLKNQTEAMNKLVEKLTDTPAESSAENNTDPTPPEKKEISQLDNAKLENIAKLAEHTAEAVTSMSKILTQMESLIGDKLNVLFEKVEILANNANATPDDVPSTPSTPETASIEGNPLEDGQGSPVLPAENAAATGKGNDTIPDEGNTPKPKISAKLQLF